MKVSIMRDDKLLLIFLGTREWQRIWYEPNEDKDWTLYEALRMLENVAWALDVEVENLKDEQAAIIDAIFKSGGLVPAPRRYQ